MLQEEMSKGRGKKKPPHVKLYTGKGTTAAACMKEMHSELCTSPAYPALKQRYNPGQLFALFPSHDITVEPAAFLGKLVMTGCSQVLRVVAEQGGW